MALARQQSNFLETVRGVQSVKLFNRQQQRAAAYQNLLVDQFNAGVRVQRLQMLYRALNGTLFGAENVTVIWLGALSVLDGGFSVGMLFAFVSYKLQFIARINALGREERRVQDAGPARRAGCGRGACRAPSATRRPPSRPPADAAIELRGVSFRFAEHRSCRCCRT